MNKFFRYITLGLSLTAFTACESELDQIKPANAVIETTAVADEQSIQSLLIGAYDVLGGTNLYGGNIMRNAELLGADPVARDIRWRGTFVDPGEVFNKNMLVTNGEASNTWLSAYNAINVCNTILENLNKVTDPSRKSRIEGEALFIRGIMHFELVRFFAKQYEVGQTNSQAGVPIVTKATSLGNFVEVKPSRNTVEEVYAAVIADLTKAETLVPVSNRFYVDRATVAAMLSRVYLQKNDFASARDAANRVINSGRYNLVPVFAFCFNNLKNSAEDVFAIQITVQDGTNNMATFFAAATFGGRGDVQIQNPHLNLYEPGDARRAMFFTDANRGRIHSTKWNDVVAANINIVRLAEMFLTRAECNFRLNTSVGASPLEDINRIRTRVGLPSRTAADLTLASILRERQLELAFEGLRIHDQKRTRANVGSRPYTDAKLIFPIPDRERNANPNLSQNESY